MLLPMPRIMGILNVTPDSFSDGGVYARIDKAIARAHEMVANGADLIDIGGESTRPGARAISVIEELDRVLPVVEALVNCGADISIDTRKPEVAEAAIKAGAKIWNDVTGLEFDKESLPTAARLDCQIVLMHMRGSPETMQDNPEYIDAVGEINNYLKGRAQAALKAGVKRENIILDPGIGFGKRLEDNLDILQRLDDFHAHGYPILLGASRKSFIGAIDGSEADERLGGSLAAALWGAAQGVAILRVHDVKQTVQALNVWRAIGKRS